MRTMIVDDEELALNVLERLVKQREELTLIYSTTVGEEVISKVADYSIELLLLDINIGNILGIELAEEINHLYPEVKIVFVTAYTEYAVSAFEVNAIDYLLKPVTKRRFNKMIEKVDKLTIQRSMIQSSLFFDIFSEGQIYKDNQTLLELRTRKASELIFILWYFSEGGLSKELLIEYLWPNQDKNSSTMMLHTTIYQIRQVFKKNNLKNPIQYKQGRYMLIVPVETTLNRLKKIIDKEPHLQGVHEVLIIYKMPCFSLSDFLWAEEFSREIHESVLSYLIDGIKKITIDQLTVSKILSRFKEDLLLEEENIEIIYHYFKKNNQLVRAAEFIKEVETYWEKELDITNSSFLNQFKI